MDNKLSYGMVILLLCLTPTVILAQQVEFTLGTASGEPGSMGNIVEVSLANFFDLRRVAVTVAYDPAALDVSNVTSGRHVTEGPGLSFNWSKPTPGTVSVSMARDTTAAVSRGSGSIARIFFEVLENAPAGDAALTFLEATADDMSGQPVQTVIGSGSFTVFILPHIAFSAESHDFAGILVGSSKTWTVTVSNVGTDILRVNELFVTDTLFSLELPELPQVVGRGGSFDLPVIFQPTTVGVATGSLMVVSNDPDFSSRSLWLTGEGIQPDIALSNTEYDFGQVTLNAIAEWGAYIYNEGKAPLAVLSVSIDHPDFSVSPNFPKVISAQDSLEVTFAYSPQSVGAVSATVTILSADADEETLTVSLSGQGIDAPDISVSTLEHDFGQILQGSNVDWNFSISNDGTSELTIDRIEFDPV